MRLGVQGEQKREKGVQAGVQALTERSLRVGGSWDGSSSAWGTPWLLLEGLAGTGRVRSVGGVGAPDPICLQTSAEPLGGLGAVVTRLSLVDSTRPAAPVQPKNWLLGIWGGRKTPDIADHTLEREPVHAPTPHPGSPSCSSQGGFSWGPTRDGGAGLLLAVGEGGRGRCGWQVWGPRRCLGRRRHHQTGPSFRHQQLGCAPSSSYRVCTCWVPGKTGPGPPVPAGPRQGSHPPLGLSYGIFRMGTVAAAPPPLGG